MPTLCLGTEAQTSCEASRNSTGGTKREQAAERAWRGTAAIPWDWACTREASRRRRLCCEILKGREGQRGTPA